MKRPYFHYFMYIFLPFFFYTSAFSCSQALYEHLSTCSHNDFELIANLLFFSYQRSMATCKMQASSLTVMTIFHSIQDNIEATRRNPSNPSPHELNIEEIKKNQDTYRENYIFYCSAISCYKQCANTLLVDQKDLFDTTTSLTILETLRHQARIAISTALGYHLITLQNLYNTLHQQWNVQSRELIHFEEWHAKTVKSLLDALSSTLPYIGTQAFSYFDRQTSSLTQQARTLLVSATQLNNFLWDTIETARALLYKDLCSTVVRCIHERTFENSCYTRFDEHGLIATPTTLLLPRLEQWIS